MHGSKILRANVHIQLSLECFMDFSPQKGESVEICISYLLEP